MLTKNLLRQYRVERGFDPATYVDKKINALNTWCLLNGIDALVVGLSGGVDSVLATALLERAATTLGSPIRRVVTMCVGINTIGATNQETIEDYSWSGVYWLPDFKVHPNNRKMRYSYKDGSRSMNAALATTHLQAWGAGQMLSVMRTPWFYGMAAELQEHGFKSIVVGTTNRDEGAYLGFMGKASDAMVDLQLISDLHKGEVIAVLKYLGAPDEVLKRVPRGDVHNNATDQQLIGAPYWYVEAHLQFLEHGHTREWCTENLEDWHEREHYWHACEDQHRRNAHKYAIGNPSVHLDCLPRFVPGGWSTTNCPGTITCL